MSLRRAWPEFRDVDDEGRILGIDVLIPSYLTL